MDHQEQTQQTEKNIVEMLEFLETSSDEENDLQQQTTVKYREDINSINEDVNDNILTENIKNNLKTKDPIKDDEKPISFIAKELKKLKQQFQWNSEEIGYIANNKRKPDFSNCMTNLSSNSQTEADINASSDVHNLSWQYKLENHWRHSFSNSYTQEIYKAIYQDTTGHPPSGSADYYQAAENYVLYGKHFLDFPENIQMLLNDKNLQNSVTESSNLVTNVSNSLYTKPNTATPTLTPPPTLGLKTTAASAAAYYQICNSMQSQARPSLSTAPGNSTAYGIFLGNKVTYVAGTPTTPSLIYNQHSTTTTNFISNSLANAALATSPTILYTNPMLTTTTQQYLTQFLSTAALTANSLQSATAGTNGSGSGVYERLIYAQMLQQQLYQTQQAAAVAAMFQYKQRVAAAATARQTSNAMALNTNRASPQPLAVVSTACTANGLTLNICNRQARSSSPSELVVLKPQSSGAIAVAETNEYSKSTTD